MGYDIQDYPHPLSTAILSHPQNLQQFDSTLSIACNNHCDGFITPIFSDKYILSLVGEPSLDNCFILSGTNKVQIDAHLKSYQVRLIYPLINQCVWELPLQQRKQFIKVLIGYSSYLNQKFFVIKLTLENAKNILQTLEDPEVAKEINKSVPNLILMTQTSGDTDENGQSDDKIWKNYIDFRMELERIKFPLFIEFALKIHPNSPINRIINRWKSEAIAYAILSSSSFTQNQKGFTILPAKHERILIDLIVLRTSFCFEFQKQAEMSKQQNFNFVEDHFKYILFAFKKFSQNKLRSDKDAINLIDYLQNPLQPYADNLESATYQVFENDQPKYDEYQSALQEALETFPKNKRVVIFYIGAGRGGLIFNAFAAAKKTQRKIFIYAIEKNLYPIQTIKKRLRQNKWEDSVKIVHTDIREYQMQEKPDIFLSQLLGGFGDNELSPECLYWAQKNIHPDTICIPTDYVSYIKPVSYQYSHRKIPIQNRQIYYTVYFGNYYSNFSSQQVWRFDHPIRKAGQKIENEQTLFDRYSKNVFTSKEDLMINGFAGYFTSKLYGSAELSILPEKPTFGMYSWFPIFFSFLKAEFLPKGQSITIEIWRKGTQKKIWYQWRYTIGEKQSAIHNEDGKFTGIEL